MELLVVIAVLSVAHSLWLALLRVSWRQAGFGLFKIALVNQFISASSDGREIEAA